MTFDFRTDLGALEAVEEHLRLETERLTRSWMRHGRNTLRNYLVQDVQDPRINVQSILTRHFLIEYLFGSEFEPLMEPTTTVSFTTCSSICPSMPWKQRSLKYAA